MRHWPGETARQTTMSVAGLVLLLGGVALVFRVVVCRRLRAMAAHFHAIAAQPAGQQIGLMQTTSRDDIGILAESFNRLAVRLQQTYSSLEERVAERTSELGRTNAELEQRIAEREEAEEALRKAKVAAEEAAQAKSSFLANMSHEVRTPMTAILGYTDLLLEGDETAESRAERTAAAQTIKRNGEYLLHILNDILDLSKIDAGRLVIERIPCRVRQVVLEAVELMRGRAEAKGLYLEVEWPEAMPAVIETDPTRLRQILVNVIGNAVKFTSVGGVRLAACVCEGGRERALQIDIVDTGEGIDAEQAQRLFQPFIQADNSTTRAVWGGRGWG